MSESGLKSSYNEVISAVDDFFFDQCDPSTATLMEEVCDLQGIQCKKINLIYIGQPMNFSVNPKFLLVSQYSWVHVSESIRD